MGRCLLGMDFGTGGAKACVIDMQGAVLGFAFEEYAIITDRPGWSEHDAHAYWQVACRLIGQCMERARVSASEVGAIAVSSALPSLVMIDKDGRPVERAYNLMDRRAVAEVQRLKETVGEERIFNLSGYRLEDHPVLVNLLWEKANRPRSFEKVWKALTIDGYITWCLTGRATANFSAAAFFGVAYDLRRRRFDGGVLKDIGIPPEILPELVECTDIVGGVLPSASAATGLAAGTPVAGGQVDCNASWLGAGAIDEGDFQSNLGTVGNFGIITRDLDFLYSEVGRLMINFPYTVDSSRTFITVPTTLTGGQCLRWIRDGFAQAEIEAERVLGVSAYDVLNLQAEKVPVGSDGLIVLPFLMGERTPIWDASARGVVFGLSLSHGKGHLLRAMMEGVAFAMYDSFRLLRDAGLRVNFPMVLNEGGAASRLWRKIICDVFNVPIVLSGRRVGAPFGDALLAGVASGALRDFRIAKEWFQGVEPMEPDQRNHETYMEYFGLFKRLYEHVKDDFTVLARLRG
jgi:sugar (pentulose or hexulose) kinase